MKYDRIAKVQLQKENSNINTYVLVGKNIKSNYIINLLDMSYVGNNIKFNEPKLAAYISSVADVINFCKDNSIYVKDNYIKDGCLMVGEKNRDKIDFDLNYIGQKNYPICFSAFSILNAKPCDGSRSDCCLDCCFCNVEMANSDIETEEQIAA